MKIFIETLGCKVNQFESQAMSAILTDEGHELVTESAGCDAFILNSCAVTAESGRKSRQALRHLRAENPDAIGVICGCYSQIEPKEAAKLGVQLVCGCSDRRKLAERIAELVPGSGPIIDVDEAKKRRYIESLPAGRVPGRTRALMRIQDGCNNYCSYCIIPYSRGPVRSMPLEECAAEACRLNAEGFRELVITGIEIASYGRDLEGKPSLIDAVETIAAAAPDARLRLGSLEPRVITDDFASRAAKIPNLCPHFHLSLQSGCDKTLHDMHRRYTTEEFFRVTERLRSAMPGCGITTDVIAGFPGETEDDFECTLRFLEECAFSAMHVFPYSVRPGTPAEKMEGQVSKSVKAERAARASSLGRKMTDSYLKSCIGKVLRVLFETEDEGMSSGHAENYVEVRCNCVEMRGKVAKVQITDMEDGVLLGKLLL